MATRDKFGPQFGPQLQLFASAGQLKRNLTYSGDQNILHGSGGPDTVREPIGAMWKRKLKESQQPVESGVHGAGVYESILEHGYDIEKGPTVFHREQSTNSFQVTDAHHRIAAAADIERLTGQPIWIGLRHYDRKTLMENVAAHPPKRRSQQ